MVVAMGMTSTSRDKATKYRQKKSPKDEVKEKKHGGNRNQTRGLCCLATYRFHYRVGGCGGGDIAGCAARNAQLPVESIARNKNRGRGDEQTNPP